MDLLHSRAFPLVLRESDSGAGGGEGQPQDPPSQGEEPSSGGRTFTQEEMDRAIKERLAREDRKHSSEVEDLRKKAARLDEIEAANKSELEKAKEAADKAHSERQEAMDRANRMAIRSSLLTEASKAGATNPELVARLLQESGDLSVDDKGDVQGAADAVKQLLEQEPYLKQSKQSSGKSGAEFGGSGSAPTPTADEFKRMGYQDRLKIYQENPELYNQLVSKR